MKDLQSNISPLEEHSHYSSLRERIVEHLFLGELLQCLWCKGQYDVEVSRAESDSFGYDLVIEAGRFIRHIQLKSNMERPRHLSLGRSLERKPSGCVIWIGITIDLKLREFGWYGNGPGEKLPDLGNFENSLRIGRNSDGKRPKRSNHVDVPFPKNFKMHSDIGEIVTRLFG